MANTLKRFRGRLQLRDLKRVQKPSSAKPMTKPPSKTPLWQHYLVTWMNNMRNIFKTKMPLAMILLSVSLSACGTPNVGRAVVANCPQAPLIPASLKTVPPEALVDYRELMLRALGP